MRATRVGRRSGPPYRVHFLHVAIECIGAIDPVATETWNLGPAKSPWQRSLQGNWSVAITAEARISVLERHIEQLLQALEARGLDSVRVDYRLRRHDEALFKECQHLGITAAGCYCRSGTGKVYFSMPGKGGTVDAYGLAVPAWIGTFLRYPARRDVLEKLRRSGAPERHVFVIVDFGGVPWPVESYLINPLKYVPDQAPALPPPVTHIWLVSTLGRHGLYWNGTAWQRFEAQDEAIDGAGHPLAGDVP